MYRFNNPLLYRIKITVPLIGMLVVLAISCKKEEGYTPPSDPKKAILGKWVLIKMDDYPYPKTEYIEYLQDSLIGIYKYATKEYIISNSKYWIDSLFNERFTYDNGFKMLFQYRYKFYDDKMRLEIVNWDATYYSLTYQRIE